MATRVRSNNPFAAEAEAEFESQLHESGNSNNISQQQTGNPDPSILEAEYAPPRHPSLNSNTSSSVISTPHATQNLASAGNHDIPSIQTEMPETNSRDSNGDNRPINNAWEQVEDSVPDEPLPAYSEVDPNAQNQAPTENNNGTTNNAYLRPSGPPPPTLPARPSSTSNMGPQYQRPTHPPPPTRLDTSFQRPDGPPPTHYLSPQGNSPRLPPRPISPRLPTRSEVMNAVRDPRGAVREARAHLRSSIYPGAAGATYSGSGNSSYGRR